ncbi:serine hydrolase domain-containing protein [Alloacidobacterium sp.]|uniref:serine hydrolase domain-containing protein n=1 Tax=Alloacidobacterium sp. TaxID=2951999 RepID=UPI002D25B2A2|nr:serine hydrolase domain-containing protein [Alloacidobacterium sp.]HYK36333.1 serine hydrolase domain-containing protein [Alloacidobacterium sp.]
MTPFRAAALLCFTAISAWAQLPTAPPAVKPVPTPATQPAAAPQTPSSGHALEPSDMQAFFDGIIPLQLERSDIAGASVLVAKDGNILLEKGYGYADEKTKKPVDPNSSIFRLASISKLFTWVSVMQLQEQGKLDLDADVNRYLDFQIKPAFGKPVTLRNLMTHTAGFEEESRDIIITNPKWAVSLRDFLIQNQPRRLFPPGVIPAYSNYGVGLASYVVQRVSGEPFEQYVQEHIFAPLGMTHSTFYQPPPKALSALPSEGYRDNTEKPPVGFEIFNPVGAGGLSSTASDMGRFGMALLNGGELDGQRILKPETLAAMWTPQFRASDQLPPICMGFYQTWRNDLRWIGHEGDLIAFHSLFFVEPKEKLILFVSYNSAGGGSKPRPEIINMFSDRYFPSDQKQTFISLPRNELNAVAGTYLTTRRSDSTRLALGNLFDERRATVDKDGVLHLEDVKDLRGHPIKWKPIAKDLWQEVGEQARLFAIRDAQRKVIRLAYDFPGVQAQRVPWYENYRLVLTAGYTSLAILAMVVMASLSRLCRRLFLRKRGKPAPQPGTKWLPFVSQSAAWVWVVMLGTLFIFFAQKGDDLMPPSPPWNKYLFLINVVTLLALFLSFFAIISGIRVWWRAGLRRITRVKYTLVALACLVLSWIAIHWNLLGPVRRI